MTRSGPTLAPAPGPHHGPGTGADAAPGFPGIFDPWQVHARDSAFIRARDGYLGTIRHDPGPPEYFAASDFCPGAYDRWLDHIWPAAGCSHPIRLGGQIHRIDVGTGEILTKPLCLDCYDHAAHVVWNNNTGELWRLTKQAIERRLNQLAHRRGLAYGVRVSHGKAAEYQARGAVHFHVLLRLDGLDELDPARLLPPPPGLTAADLEDATRHAAATISYLTPPHPASPPGWLIGWGTELDVRVITVRGTGTVTDVMVASYLAKYSTKGTEVTGHTSARLTPATVELHADATGTHAERLIHACWRLGSHPEFRSLQRWAHMLGFGGHFLTKGRHYSITFAALRAARITYRRTQDPGPEHGPIRTAEQAAEETTLIVGHLTYAATGWKTTGDALLASTAADQARKRRQAGNEELTGQYDTTTGRQAA